MRQRRQLLLLALVTASLVIATGTNGFSVVEADRGANVVVVDDPNAYLGLEPNVAGCGDHDRYKVTNQFGTEIDVTASVVDAATNLSGVVTDAPSGLAAGESGTIDARVTPIGNTTPSGWVTLYITAATGSGTRAELFRTVSTACLPTGDVGGGTGNEGNGGSPDKPKDVSFVALCAANADESATFSASGGPKEVTWSGPESAVDTLVYKAGQSVYEIENPDTTFESGEGTKLGAVGDPGGSNSEFANDPCGQTQPPTEELVKFEYTNGQFTAVYEE